MSIKPTASAPMSIPRIIHQIWLGPNPAPTSCMETWRKRHPDWECRLWTEDNLPALKNQEAFNRSKKYAQKADILRYELLYGQGGVYVDADMYCLRSMDRLLDVVRTAGKSFFAAYEGSPDLPHLISNSVMGCSPGNPDVKCLVDDVDVTKRGSPWQVTGPLYLTESVRSHQMAVHLFPAATFCPFHHSDRTHRGVIDIQNFKNREEVYAVQFWGSTTHSYKPLWRAAPVRRLVFHIRSRLNRTISLKE